MSSIEQLKKNVTATLETTGVLARIRAELRAEVFAAIEMQKPVGTNIPQTMDDFARTEFGKQSIDLVVEFLHFFGLKHTLSVFIAETHRPDCAINRDSLWNSVSRTANEFSLRKPLLVSLLEHNKQTLSSGVSQSNDDPFAEGRSSVSKQHVQQAAASSQAQTATIYQPEPQNQVSTLVDNSSSQPGNISVLEFTKASVPQNQGKAHVGLIDQANAFTTVESTPSHKSLANVIADVNPSLGKKADKEFASSLSATGDASNTPPVTVPIVQEAKPSNPMEEQLQQINNLLKQLDSKQKLTNIAKAHLKSDSHHLVEDFSDSDDVEFDYEDFDNEPDGFENEADKNENAKSLSESSSKPPSAPRPVNDMVECFSDDSSADEDALDAFDVVHEVRLISQRTI